MNPAPLSRRLRDSTQDMHRLAERAAFMTRLLRGEMPLAAYCAYLRNLHAIYAALEGELESLARSGDPPPWLDRSVFRVSGLEADLERLHGAPWRELAVTRAASDYARHLGSLPRDGAHRLAAHAYVRYLGDLSGGQAIGPVIARAYGLAGGEGTAFYAFGESPEGLKARLREGLDAYGEAIGPARAGEVVEEAVRAFARHRALFDELVAAA